MQYAIVIIFVIAGIAILASIIYGLAGFIKNNNSPIETVDAKVISKRTDVTGYNNYNYDYDWEVFVCRDRFIQNLAVY